MSDFVVVCGHQFWNSSERTLCPTILSINKLKTATCECTGGKILLKDGFFVANTANGDWSFLSMDAPEQSGEYTIAVNVVVKSPEGLVDWIAHLNEKTWFDAKKFADFFSRFRKANNLFGSL